MAEDDEREKSSDRRERHDEPEQPGTLVFHQPADEKSDAYQDDPDRIEYLGKNDSGQKHVGALNFKPFDLSRPKTPMARHAMPAFGSRNYTIGHMAIPLEVVPWLDLPTIRLDGGQG
ncbi:hypothetical protein LGH82_01440 [Mesorhizobium sp. PAMC28654]|uniref:hypothetical protein n=1 Tax=Mesorhizobium sp. PAMC28654 TaxID=2880934 RepID=UPI001D0B89D1|nr:hypothetical protein [Mesorhizobium sp. PAMC28654]UDL90095.1 hypothetical protein LGH82_01440 [Mesorhizobium sp. PAMC28654]